MKIIKISSALVYFIMSILSRNSTSASLNYSQNYPTPLKYWEPASAYPKSGQIAPAQRIQKLNSLNISADNIPDVKSFGQKGSFNAITLNKTMSYQQLEPNAPRGNGVIRQINQDLSQIKAKLNNLLCPRVALNQSDHLKGQADQRLSYQKQSEYTNKAVNLELSGYCTERLACNRTEAPQQKEFKLSRNQWQKQIGSAGLVSVQKAQHSLGDNYNTNNQAHTAVYDANDQKVSYDNAKAKNGHRRIKTEAFDTDLYSPTIIHKNISENNRLQVKDQIRSVGNKQLSTYSQLKQAYKSPLQLKQQELQGIRKQFQSLQLQIKRIEGSKQATEFQIERLSSQLKQNQKDYEQKLLEYSSFPEKQAELLGEVHRIERQTTHLKNKNRSCSNHSLGGQIENTYSDKKNIEEKVREIQRLNEQMFASKRKTEQIVNNFTVQKLKISSQIKNKIKMHQINIYRQGSEIKYILDSIKTLQSKIKSAIAQNKDKDHILAQKLRKYAKSQEGRKQVQLVIRKYAAQTQQGDQNRSPSTK